MIDMAYTKAEKKSDGCEVAMTEKPDYPWGLEIRLEKESLDKLGIKQMPVVGEIININALCKVTACSQSVNDSEGSENENRCVTLQITAIGIVQGGSDKGSPPAQQRAKSILGYYQGGGNGS